MAKRVSSFDLTLALPSNGKPGYRWLYGAVRTEILEGRLPPGARLPATRDLAATYRLSRGTIVNAFEQLKAEGYLEGTTGSGTFVSGVLPDELLGVRNDSRARPHVDTVPERHLSNFGTRVQPLAVLQNRRSRAFRPNLPALDLFPKSIWAQLVARRLRQRGTEMLLGCEAMGYGPLREAIAAYVSASRGVKCDAEQIVIVSGTQEALDLVARIFLNPGDRVCVEDPGYDGVTSACEAAGAIVCGVPVDGEGMQVPSRRIRDARVVFVAPGHQHPLGMTMSLRRRLELLEWARGSGALIFEDDYDGEYRYSGRPVPALQGLDRSGIVLYAGSFSKTMFPALRLGYLVVPPDLVAQFSATKSISSRHIPLLEQAVLCDFITGGHFGRHLRRMREIYSERLTALLDAARERLSGLLEISTVEAGLQTSGWLRDGIDGEAAAAAAAQRNVEVTSLSRFARAPLARQGLQLGFAAVDPGEIRRGVRDLAAALESLA
jgi:GntR family transcriptional regulator/MocR family aminotransferase